MKRLTHVMFESQWGSLAAAFSFNKAVFFYSKSHENSYQYYKSRENSYQYYKSHENPYQVLQVTRAVSERAMYSKVHMIKSLSP